MIEFKVDMFIIMMEKWYDNVNVQLTNKGLIKEAREILDMKNKLNELKTNILTTLQKKEEISNEYLAESFVSEVERLKLRDKLFITDLGMLPVLLNKIYETFWPERMNIYKFYPK